MSKQSGSSAPDWKPSATVRNLYKLTGTTDKGANKSLLIVSRSPLEVIKTAETDFYIERVTGVSELGQVWTPRSL